MKLKGTVASPLKWVEIQIDGNSWKLRNRYTSYSDIYLTGENSAVSQKIARCFSSKIIIRKYVKVDSINFSISVRARRNYSPLWINKMDRKTRVDRGKDRYRE